MRLGVFSVWATTVIPRPDKINILNFTNKHSCTQGNKHFAKIGFLKIQKVNEVKCPKVGHGGLLLNKFLDPISMAKKTLLINHGYQGKITTLQKKEF